MSRLSTPALGLASAVVFAASAATLAAGRDVGDASDMLARARAEAPRDLADRNTPPETARRDSSQAEQRVRELDHISALIRQAKEKRANRLAAVNEIRAQRGSVLLLLQPGRTGIRRFARTADPILCAVERCYISQGSERDALVVTRKAALGMGNTLGKRADACNHQLGCVFRNVEVGPGVSLEPVDLHILKHDVREAASALVDTSCRVLRGQLGCAGAIHSATYTMWIVPENTVDKLGPGVMARAVAGGLASAQTAAMQ